MAKGHLKGRFGQQFTNLKTRTKLLISFGLVSLIILVMSVAGIITLRQLSSQSQTVYADYTVPLASFAEMGTALTAHHQIITGVAHITRQDDFNSDIARLPQYRQTVRKVLAEYEATTLRTSRSGRDEAKDLAVLKPAVQKYFAESEGALSAMADSFDKSLSADAAENMRGLGQLALTVNLQPTFDKLMERHHEQVRDMQEIARDMNDDAQTLAGNGTLILVFGGFVAVAFGIGIGYLMSGFLARNIVHIADVATQAAGGNLQARAQLQSDDELGHMAQSFNTMLDRITALVSTDRKSTRLNSSHRT